MLPIKSFRKLKTGRTVFRLYNCNVNKKFGGFFMKNYFDLTGQVAIITGCSNRSWRSDG